METKSHWIDLIETLPLVVLCQVIVLFKEIIIVIRVIKEMARGQYDQIWRILAVLEKY